MDYCYQFQAKNNRYLAKRYNSAFVVVVHGAGRSQTLPLVASLARFRGCSAHFEGSPVNKNNMSKWKSEKRKSMRKNKKMKNNNQ